MATKTTRQHNRTGTPRREEFLSAALTLFSVKGYAATSTRDICAEVGVAHSAIYHYFPSKDDILRELEQREMRPMQEGAERILASVSRSEPLRRLETLLCYTIDVAIERRRAWLLFQDMLRHLPDDDRRTFIEHRKLYERTIVTAVQDAIDAGHLPEQDSKLAVNYFFGIIDGIVRWFRADGRLSANQIIKHSTEFFIGALRAGTTEVTEASD